MSNQRKLTALLHELQHARSPLAQARVLARGWRTVRELSPTDRRLLARHAGFDGAEEILEGLSQRKGGLGPARLLRVLARAWRTVRELSPTDRRLLARHAGFEGAEDILEGLSQRKGGLAPALLLRVLDNARGTDSSTVSELLAAFRDPQRRDEAISLGAELANDLLAETVAEEVPEEVSEAIEELQAVEESIIETPEEALAALNALESEEEANLDEPPASAPETNDSREAETETVPPQRSEPQPEPKSPPPPPKPPVVDWSRWHDATASRRPAPVPRQEVRPSVSEVGSRRFEARAVMGAMGAEQSVFSQLRVLRRELSGFAGSSVNTLRELIEAFPDGWARRRALCALLESGIPAETRDALELVSGLGRELDRRWCLGLLARKGDLRGALLSQALDLVDSEYSKRRLTAIAG